MNYSRENSPESHDVTAFRTIRKHLHPRAVGRRKVQIPTARPPLATLGRLAHFRLGRLLTTTLLVLVTVAVVGTAQRIGLPAPHFVGRLLDQHPLLTPATTMTAASPSFTSASTTALRAASRMLCIGHRGVAALYPENTLPSLVAALDQGADGIELDIRLTLDNEVIVMHDPTLDRSTNVTGNVRDWTWERMQREGVVAKKTHLGYGQCFGERAGKPDEHKEAGPMEAPIPRLVDVLDMLVEYPREVGCIIDIKWDNPLSIMTHLHAILALPRYTALLPRITLGIWSPHFIFSLPPTSMPVKRSFIGSNLTLARLCSRAVDTFSLDMDVVLANPEWVRARKAKGYTITTWTVDGEDNIANVMAQGLVDGIITDCVGQCVSVRDEVRRVERAVAQEEEAKVNAVLDGAEVVVKTAHQVVVAAADA